jgi:hypothetical protein
MKSNKRWIYSKILQNGATIIKYTEYKAEGDPKSPKHHVVKKW